MCLSLIEEIQGKVLKEKKKKKKKKNQILTLVIT